MPGDPDILDEAPEVPAILNAADLLMAVAVKLPPFWPDNIKTWLVQAESQFRLKGVVTSQTKFDYVVLSMSQTNVVKVLDLIRIPPQDYPYGHLQNCLTSMYGLTNYACYKAITSLPFLGDMLPSALISKMLSLLPSRQEACFFLRGAFLKCLPADVRSHLVHNRTLDPLSLALPAN